MSRRVAVVGAQGSGVQALAEALGAALVRRAADAPPLWQVGGADLQPTPDLTLLTGLDWPLAADPADRSALQQREAADAQLRDRLLRSGQPLRVVYGDLAQRLERALAALDALAPEAAALPTRNPAAHPATPAPWTWVCDTCSDPVCEHRLFTARLGLAAAADSRQ